MPFLASPSTRKGIACQNALQDTFLVDFQCAFKIKGRVKAHFDNMRPYKEAILSNQDGWKTVGVLVNQKNRLWFWSIYANMQSTWVETVPLLVAAGQLCSAATRLTVLRVHGVEAPRVQAAGPTSGRVSSWSSTSTLFKSYTICLSLLDTLFWVECRSRVTLDEFHTAARCE